MGKELTMSEVAEFSQMRTIADCKRYIQVMLDFYYDVIIAPEGRIAHNYIEDDMNLWVQTMFSKCNTYLSLLDGVGYSHLGRQMNRILDMSVLFSIARSMYESLIVFELLYVLPNSRDEQTILYNLFMVHGLAERLKDLTEDMKVRNLERMVLQDFVWVTLPIARRQGLPMFQKTFESLYL